MTKEEIISAFKFIESKCDKIINNKNYVADDFVQDTVEDISEMCNRILDGQFGEILETKPDISSNLDEAAIKYGHEEPILPEGYNDGDIPLYERWTADAFKAGAEWMAGQGASFKVNVEEVPQDHWYAGLHLGSCAEEEESALKSISAKDGEEVIVQIRKK